MSSGETIVGTKRRVKRHAGMFGPGGRDPKAHVDPTKLVAARWSKDRRQFVQLAQEVRPESFATIVSIMRDEKVEPPTRLRAAELLVAYSDGRPRQSVDLNVGGPRNIDTIPTAELEAMLLTGHIPFALEHRGQIIEAEVIREPVTAGVAQPVPVGDKHVSRRAKGDSA